MMAALTWQRECLISDETWGVEYPSYLEIVYLVESIEEVGVPMAREEISHGLKLHPGGFADQSR